MVSEPQYTLMCKFLIFIFLILHKWVTLLKLAMQIPTLAYQLFNLIWHPNCQSNYMATKTFQYGKPNFSCLCIVTISGHLDGSSTSPYVLYSLVQSLLIQNTLIAFVDPTIATTVAATNLVKTAWDALHIAYVNKFQIRIFSLRD